MSEFDQAVNDYLTLRRGLGFELEMHGRVLPQFAEFLQQRDATLITSALALEFARVRVPADPRRTRRNPRLRRSQRPVGTVDPLPLRGPDVPEESVQACQYTCHTPHRFVKAGLLMA